MLTSEDIDRCNKMVEDFIGTTDPQKTLILNDRLMINQCFYHFKHIFKDMQKKKGGAGGGSQPAAIGFGGPNFGNADMSPPPGKGGAVAVDNSKEMRDM